jgi:DNA-binding CsgD family transcriptional regulator
MRTGRRVRMARGELPSPVVTSSRQPSSCPVRLTGRERRVLAYAAAGASIAATARYLGVSADTVKSQRERAKRKLGARTIAAATFLAASYGLFAAKDVEKLLALAELRRDGRRRPQRTPGERSLVRAA